MRVEPAHRSDEDKKSLLHMGQALSIGNVRAAPGVAA